MTIERFGVIPASTLQIGAELTVDAPLKRLQCLAPLDVDAVSALARSAELSRHIAPRRRLFEDGSADAPIMILSGWAARSRNATNGARQLLNVLLPGDVVHPVDHGSSPLIALTTVSICKAPSSDQRPSLAEAYRLSQQLGESYLLAQIARLGGMSAQQRLFHFVAELYERHFLSGLTIGNSFLMPVSQATIADTLGMTAVHANRMIQGARSSGELTWVDHTVTLADGSAVLSQARRNLAAIRVSSVGDGRI